MKRKNAWLSYHKEDLTAIESVTKAYRHFLDHGKTERECVVQIIKQAKEKGYRDLEELIAQGAPLRAGDKVYAVHMKKVVALFTIGEKPFTEGMRILGAHIDSPRLDVKQNPLYEDDSLAYFDTHYYGGIKKYQWVAMPLAIHGVVALKDGSVIDVVVGEEDTDPVFCVTDLLPHLGQEQMEKKAGKVVEGEHLDLLIGSYPVGNEEDMSVIKHLLSIFEEK